MSAQDPIAERLKALRAELQEMGAEIARKAEGSSAAFARAETRAKAELGAAAEDAMAVAGPVIEEALKEAQRAAEDFAAAAAAAQERARQTAIAHPLTVVAVSFLAGLVLGSLRRR